MDFSAGALLIGMKFCTAVRPHLGQVFYFGVDSPNLVSGIVLAVNEN